MLQPLLAVSTSVRLGRRHRRRSGFTWRLSLVLQTAQLHAVTWAPLTETGDKGPVGEPVCKLTGNLETPLSYLLLGQVAFTNHEGGRFEWPGSGPLRGCSEALNTVSAVCVVPCRLPEHFHLHRGSVNGCLLPLAALPCPCGSWHSAGRSSVCSVCVWEAGS